MKYACINCLEPVEYDGTMCDKCKAIIHSGWYGETMWSETHDYDPPEQIDEVYINQLKERRMRGYAAARRRAKGIA